MPVTVLEAVEWMVRERPERARPPGAWPCCTLVAEALAAAGGYTYGRTWWDRANVVDPTAPWSLLGAAGDVVRHVGPVTAPGVLVEPGPDRAWTSVDVARVIEALVPGRWHVIQLWWSLDAQGHGRAPEAKGHALLWYADAGGLGYRLESDVSRGLRLGGRPWHGGPPPTVDLIRAEDWIDDCDAGVGVVPLWES